MSLISLDYVRKACGVGRAQRTVLDDVSLEVDSGQFVTVLDPSGAANTVLLEVTAGLTDADDGNIVIGNTDLTRATSAERHELLAHTVGVLYDSDNLMPALTIADNLDLPARLGNIEVSDAQRARISELFDLAPIAKYYPDAVSRADQQRVAIAARVLAGRTIMLCDEPTAGLDTAQADSILALLRTCVRELGMTVVTFTANALAAQYADRVFILASGKNAGELTDPTLDAIFNALQAIHGEV
ncbi:ABC transporter ATP-binding protein [Trueperella bialowiezensis]|uniref:Macrolide export ATP-binding/permease protein MacB n=1 Tax=Trueperella bialowiezensis TaxID=312285 RepID=A0A3S4UZT3_9ACTO|nr:ATP-binding cassette domain-containing protein [Trueperella bialowiezensis]VEI13823.1 Macrolide export ATP-binding/permease protein MacB [Trueperella bialowiezensis]